MEEINKKIFVENMNRTIYLAGGCFWGMQKYVGLIRGVVDTEVGFANGNTINPSYKEVYTDSTGHAETVRVEYDPAVLDLRDLVRFFFKAIDPTSVNKQGEDCGTRYRTGVYYTDPAERPAIEEVFDEVRKGLGLPTGERPDSGTGEDLAVECLPLECFYPAEEYHQDYLYKNPDGYCHLRPELFEYARSVNRELVRPEITAWIDESVIPRYDAFDKGHRRDHAEYVIATALELSRYYPVDREMVAVAAACHDLGLAVDRATHHLESGRIIRGMSELGRWFSPEQIETVAQAAEDHRASSKDEPRSIYGKLVAEADRQIIPEVVIRRTVQFGLKHYPELEREGHWLRTLEHLEEKYAEGGYLKLWIPESANAARLEDLRKLIRDKSALRRIFDSAFDE